MSEDCLTLNIIRPAGLSAKSALPVLVWIYGGGFSEGAGSIYDGSPVVSQSVNRGTPVIYVNFNYRLGPLGVRLHFRTSPSAPLKGAL
jgi:acetylcholinesterase